MFSKKVELRLLFETSWEVCNKVGGIYTVLSTKAKNLQTLYKDRVIFIGPDINHNNEPNKDFSESKSLLKTWKKTTVLPFGIKVRVGRWNVPGKPIAILVSFDELYHVKNDFYAEMWQQYGVDSLHAYGDYDESCMFSLAAGMVIESLVNFYCPQNNDIIAHFDEWTTGMGLLYIKNRLPHVATVFTTHATSIGRSICGNGKELYRYFKGYHGDQMAQELNMVAKHSLEKAAAHNADCFTTVSEITAEECEQLLDKRPDVVTPNGFENDFVPTDKSISQQRKKARKKLLDIARALTGKEFDDSTFLIGTAGRCEYRNKGLDMFIDSVYKLSESRLSRNVLALIMVPAWVDKARQDLISNLSSKNKSTCERLDNPFITHYLHNFEDDAVVRHLRAKDFGMTESVSCLYIPCYLNGNDGIIDIPYYRLLPGLDASVFPSYYEPWGYTPLESIAFGVPTITTSLSGFGRWILSNNNNDIFQSGVKVVERDDSNYEQAVISISSTLLELMEKASAIDLSKVSKATAQKATWQYFIENYILTYEKALKNAQYRVMSAKK